MSEPITNGTTYPPQPSQNIINTQVVEHLNLRELLLERGTSGLRRAGGYVREEILTDLVGLAGVRKYKEMRDGSAVIGACLYALECLIRNVKWRFTPVDTSEEAQRYAALADGMIFDDLDMSWSLLISEILSFLPFGWSWFELVFKRRLGLNPPPMPDGTPAPPSKFNDGLVGVAKIAPRAQDSLLRWAFNSQGDLLGLHQLDPWMGRQAYIPYEKSLLFRPTSYKNNPEGRSILRTAYRAWYMILHIENTEGITIERDGTGLPLMYVPPQWSLATATPEEVAQFELCKRLVRNVRIDEQAGLVLPAIYDQAGNQLLRFELVTSGGSRAINTDEVIQRYELRITQSLLCDLLFLGHEDVGSFALASSKSTIQAMSLGGYLTVIKDEVNRRLMPLLWRLNALPPEYMPELTHGDVETVDLTELARFMLSFGRVYPMQDLENHIRTMAGLPEREGAETHPLPPAIQPNPGQGGHGEGLGSHGGGSGLGISPQSGSPGEVGLPDLDRALEPQSLSLSMDDAPPTPVRKAPRRRRATRAAY